MILNELFDMYNEIPSRFFYLDFEYMSNLKTRSDLKKYFAFWLQRAFFMNDSDKYTSFYKTITDSINYEQYEFIIKSLIQFNNNNYYGKRLFFIFNNVKGEKHHTIINRIKQYTREESYHHNFLIFCDIEDSYNFQKFDEIYKNDDIKLILIPNLIFSETSDDMACKVKELFAEYNEIKFADLIKIFHFSSFLNYKYEKKEKDFSELSLIKKYIKFFDLIVENDLDETKPLVKNIKFKNKEIETQFLIQYENYFLNSIESDEKLKAVLNLNDGELFEKLIILDIITGKIKKNNNNNFITIEVNSLFGLEIENLDLEKYKDKNIIFTQKNKTTEIFDFGILINQNGQLIMKLYQVSTKKSKNDLEKLDVDIIKLHCINISKKLEKIGNIQKFSFGIITSYNCYSDKKNDFKLMKEDCENKNFELLIYKIKEKKFYIEKRGDENNKENILLCLENIDFINDINCLDLPNYDTFFKLKPKLKTMKFINKNYNYCLEDYYDTTHKYNDIKIIGKIEYDQSFINSTITDNNLGLLISGYIPGKKFDRDKKLNLSLVDNDINYRIIKESGKNKIYKRDPKAKYIEQIQEFNSKLSKPHILLYKFNEKNYLSKKRNPENLFLEDIISNKKKK